MISTKDFVYYEFSPPMVPDSPLAHHPLVHRAISQSWRWFLVLKRTSSGKLLPFFSKGERVPHPVNRSGIILLNTLVEETHPSPCGRTLSQIVIGDDPDSEIMVWATSSFASSFWDANALAQFEATQARLNTIEADEFLNTEAHEFQNPPGDQGIPDDQNSPFDPDSQDPEDSHD